MYLALGKTNLIIILLTFASAVSLANLDASIKHDSIEYEGNDGARIHEKCWVGEGGAKLVQLGVKLTSGAVLELPYVFRVRRAKRILVADATMIKIAISFRDIWYKKN